MTVHTFICGYLTLIINLDPSPGRYLDMFEGILRLSLSSDPLE